MKSSSCKECSKYVSLVPSLSTDDYCNKHLTWLRKIKDCKETNSHLPLDNPG